MNRYCILAVYSFFLFVGSCYAMDVDTPLFEGGFNPSLESHRLQAQGVIEELIAQDRILTPDELHDNGIPEITHAYILENRTQVSPQLTSPQKAVAALTELAVKEREKIGSDQPFSEEIGHKLIDVVPQSVLLTPTKGPNGSTWFCIRFDFSSQLPDTFCTSSKFSEILAEDRKQDGSTNIMRLLAGMSPVVQHQTPHKSDSKRYFELLNAHHISQKADGNVFCFSKRTHNEFHSALHATKKDKESPVIHGFFNCKRRTFYQQLALRRLHKWLGSKTSGSVRVHRITSRTDSVRRKLSF